MVLQNLSDPLPDEPYSGVLRDDDGPSTVLRALGGSLIALSGFLVAASIVPALITALTWVAGGRHGTFEDAYAATAAFTSVPGFVATNLGIALGVVVAAGVVALLHARHPRWLSSVQPGFRWRYAVVCLVLAVVVFVLMQWARGELPTIAWHAGDLPWILAILLTSPLQAAGEEFIFRGYLLQACGALTRRPIMGVVLSALVFALMHGTQSLPLFVDRLGFGLLAGMLVLLTGGLEAAVAIHVANNVLAFGLAVLSGAGVASLRGMTDSTWTMTALNLVTYGLLCALCWALARRMRTATLTPNLSNAG